MSCVGCWLWFEVSCSMFVDHWLFVVCCVVLVVCCLLFVGRWPLIVGDVLLIVACCLVCLVLRDL